MRYFNSDWECFVIHIELDLLDRLKTCLEQNFDLVGRIVGKRVTEQKFGS